MNNKVNDILFKLKEKDPEAIDMIIDTYGSLVKSIIIKNLFLHKEIWEECFNDVLMAIWNNPERFDDKKSNFKNWICAIAKYKAIDTLRREFKHQETFVSMDCESDIDWLHTSYFVENGIELIDDSLEELNKLLCCLSDDDKDIFFRRYVNDQPVYEIAKEKNITHDHIYSRISRGKKKIKKHMECEQGGALNGKTV